MTNYTYALEQLFTDQDRDYAAEIVPATVAWLDPKEALTSFDGGRLSREPPHDLWRRSFQSSLPSERAETAGLKGTTLPRRPSRVGDPRNFTWFGHR